MFKHRGLISFDIFFLSEMFHLWEIISNFVKLITKRKKDMKKCFIILFLLSTIIYNGYSQSLLKSENDSTFTAEYRNGDEWAMIAKEGFIVGVSNKLIKDDYGKFYRLQIMIQNLSNNSFVFTPETVTSYCTLKDQSVNSMKVYTSESFQKMIRNKQMWAEALTGFANGLNAGMAGYSTSYVSTPYGGYTVSTYNPGNAAVANMIATNQMMEMGKQMENDRRIRDEGYLKMNTIHPGEGIVGYMFVKKQRGVIMEVQIPVNGVVFDYKWNIGK